MQSLVDRTITPVAAHYFDAVAFCRVTAVLPRCAVGDIAKPFVRVDDLDIKTVADFCELFAEASGPFRGERAPYETPHENNDQAIVRYKYRTIRVFNRRSRRQRHSIVTSGTKQGNAAVRLP